jgi:hypothetical protein
MRRNLGIAASSKCDSAIREIRVYYNSTIHGGIPLAVSP